MFGRAYKTGRLVERYSGGGNRMKPSNGSEVMFGLFVIVALLFIVGSCVHMIQGG